MNFKQLILITIFAITPPLYAAPSITDMTAHEILRARQTCERSQPRAVCIEMERARYQELQEQRVKEALQRKRELQRDRDEHRGRDEQKDHRNRRDRDWDDDRDRRDWDNDRNRHDDRGRDRNDRDEDARARYCLQHPEICEAQRRAQEERATQQAWCERKFSRQQCLEMRERNERKPSKDVPNHRDRDDRTRDIDRRDRRERPRVIEPREESPYNRPYRRPAQD